MRRRFNAITMAIGAICLLLLFVSCPSGADEGYIETVFTSEDGKYEFRLNEDEISFTLYHYGYMTELEKEEILPSSFRNMPITRISVSSDAVEKLVVPENVREVVQITSESLMEIELPDTVTALSDRAFSGCSRLKEVILNEGLISIGSYAFANCASLSTIALPDSLETIGNGAFSSSGITSIRLSENLSVVGSSIFENCTNLQTVYVPFGRYYTAVGGWKRGWDWLDYQKPLDETAIIYNDGKDELSFVISEDRTYYICCGLPEDTKETEVTIPAEYKDLPVLEIAANAFDNCSSVTSITLSEGLKKIGISFNNCISLASVTFPSSLESADFAFIGCTGLTEVVIPDDCKVKTLDSTFSGCTSLEKISLPSSLEELNFTFSGCTALKEVIIPSQTSLRIIGDLAFQDAALTDFSVPATVEIIGDNAFSDIEELSISFTADSKLKSIGDNAFARTGLKEFRIPSSVETIGESAFAECTALQSITIPSNVENIGRRAFYDTGLSLADFSDSSALASIGEEAFFQTKLTDLDLSNCISLETIGGRAFSGCLLSDVSFPENLERIEEEAFYANKFTELVFPSSLSYIGEDAFAFCTALTEITISHNTQTIDRGAFRMCNNIGKVYVDYARHAPSDWLSFPPENVDVISSAVVNTIYYHLPYFGDGYYVDGMLPESSVIELTIPAEYNSMPVTDIGNDAFSGIATLESIIVEEGIESIHDKAFSHCTSLRFVKLPSTLSYLGASVFSRCEKLTTLEIPDTLTRIDGGCFSNSGLTSISIPASVEYVEQNAFYGCEDLSDIYVAWDEGQKPSGWSSYWADGIPSNCTIHYNEQGGEDPGTDPDNPGGEQDEEALRFIIDTYSNALDAMILDIQLGNRPSGVVTDPSDILTVQDFSITMNDVHYENVGIQFVFNGTYERSLDMNSYTQVSRIALTEGSSIDGVPHTASWTATTSMNGSSTTDAIVDGVPLEDQSVNI